MNQSNAYLPFFTNKDCACFPCHEGIDPENFNCMFCYCPFYVLGDNCGGTPSYTDKGIKDCSQCTRMHERNAGINITPEQFNEITRIASHLSE